MTEEIAIIGLSMKVAGAENLESFWQFIQEGKAAFNYLSDLRRKDIFDRFGMSEIAAGAYLDRVDLFDNVFFKISPAEAERMDPEQRLMLEYGVKAVYNAGYTIKELKGDRIGIFHTLGESQYRHFFDEASNLSLTSHMQGMVGTRLANFMDWRGPVIGFDTTCSSGLTALYYACESLAKADCRMALVGGVNLGITFRDHIKNSPVMSKTEQCRPFDSSADGTLGGEGVFCILVKKAKDAVRDGDPIHAIIKGAAINHGGELIQNISAPSPVSQSQVIRMAWENSNTDPRQVRFIQAHGTGTILGDPIEFKGISSAFEGTDPDKVICSVSSVKGQLGHLNTLAGLAGLTTLVAALKHRCLLPQVGFHEINNHINENSSPVKVQREMEHWDNNGELRTGGVSSFGMTGTNLHMVLSEYISPVKQKQADGLAYMIKVAGSTVSKVNSVKEYLKAYIANNYLTDPSQLCYSANKVRQEEVYGQMISFKDYAELQQSLDAASFLQPRYTTEKKELFLLIPGLLKPESISLIKKRSPQLNDLYQAQLQSLAHLNISLNHRQHSFLLNFCCSKLLIEAGFSPDKIIGAQSGKLVSVLLSGKMTLEQAVLALASDNIEEEPFNRPAFILFLNSLDPGKKYVLNVMGGAGEMVEALIEWTKENNKPNVEVLLSQNEAETWNTIIAGYYNQGNDIELEKLFARETSLHDFHLPFLEPYRFWPYVEPIQAAGQQSPLPSDKMLPAVQPQPGADLSFDKIAKEIQSIWSDKLKMSTIGLSDNFFDVGGSSLLGLDVLDSIEEKFGIGMNYEDIFKYSTIEAQAKFVYEKLRSTK